MNINEFNEAYLKQHFISFTSDGALVMLSINRGVGLK